MDMMAQFAKGYTLAKMKYVLLYFSSVLLSQ